MTRPLSSSLDPHEVARFSAAAPGWWDESGPFAALHRLTPVRLAYLERLARTHLGGGASPGTLEGLRVLDVGCGGGLLAEPLARRGAHVTGLDASAEAIAVAKDHAQEQNLSIAYHQGTAEVLAGEHPEAFDLVLAMELLEHVADVPALVQALAKLVRPGGIVAMASLNKTRRSFLLGIVMAEYVLGWVPPGTHNWDRFQRPSAVAALWEAEGLQTLDVTGVVFNPLSRQFEAAAHRTSVNYMMAGIKPVGKKAG